MILKVTFAIWDLSNTHTSWKIARIVCLSATAELLVAFIVYSRCRKLTHLFMLSSRLKWGIVHAQCCGNKCLYLPWTSKRTCYVMKWQLVGYTVTFTDRRRIRRSILIVAKYCDEYVSVCICVFVFFCLSVCLSARISSEPHARSLPKFCTCCLWPCLGPLPASLRYVMYFRFCRWLHVFSTMGRIAVWISLRRTDFA